MEFKKDLEIWKGALVRALVILGLSYFGLSLSNGMQFVSIEASLITSGLYMFMELAKYYKISYPTKNKNYKYLIFP